MPDAARVLTLADRVLQEARDREKTLMYERPVGGDQLLPFLRAVKELAVEVLRHECPDVTAPASPPSGGAA